MMNKKRVKKAIAVLMLTFLCISMHAKDVENQYCSFDVPGQMELQQGYFADLRQAAGANGGLFDAVLQQKGLNATTESYDGYVSNSHAYDDYCRITINCSEWTGGLGDLNDYDMEYTEKLLYDYLSSVYELPEWNGIKKTTFKGYIAYVMDYVRGSVSGGENVHVYNMTLSTETNDWTIVFAARERSLSRWITAFREFGESFEFVSQPQGLDNRIAEISRYEIAGTEQDFFWYRKPQWQTSLFDGVRFTNFTDENYDTDGYITVSVSVMDLSGMVSGKVEQLGFLLGVQQQMAYMVLEAMSGIPIRVKENTLDSENNIFTYRYSYSELGFDIEGLILYNFSGSKCIAYTAEWDAGHVRASDIIDAYVTKLT